MLTILVGVGVVFCVFCSPPWLALLSLFCFFVAMLVIVVLVLLPWFFSKNSFHNNDGKVVLFISLLVCFRVSKCVYSFFVVFPCQHGGERLYRL